ncbi:hypothetical protein CYMTET_56997 [Cymbomonas tetramitiformis]|uniref:Uncharacterized protein n=1 Tax=Cymbomonas tetramitiformis TaxID=36881 RepID=A0AAE0ELQ5_9CHLO|nr:hypothetical protein CYMTET_56997 [Cymbomonas tetramitiformis]
MDDKEGGHAEEAGRTSAQDEVLHAHEGDEDAGGPMTMDGDGEPEDGNEEDVEADEESEHGDDGADDEGVKTQILEQLEDGDAWKEKKARYPEFFQELRNVIILLCADGASVWKNKAGVFPIFSEEYVRVRCMLLGVIMDYKGLVDAAKRMDVNSYKCCMKCPTKGCHSAGLSRIFYAFNQQNPPGPPDDYTHAFVKRMGEIHEILSQSGRSKAEMMERFTAMGIKLPSAMARLVYFDLVLDWLFDPMHEIMNLGNRLAKTLLGLDFNEGVRDFAKEQGVHPEWLRTKLVQNSKGQFQQ